jgi:hypothetical protein
VAWAAWISDSARQLPNWLLKKTPQRCGVFLWVQVGGRNARATRTPVAMRSGPGPPIREHQEAFRGRNPAQRLETGDLAEAVSQLAGKPLKPLPLPQSHAKFRPQIS